MSQPPDKSKSTDNNNNNNPSSGQSSGGGGGSSASNSSSSQVGGTRPAQNDRSGSGGTVNASTGTSSNRSGKSAGSSSKQGASGSNSKSSSRAPSSEKSANSKQDASSTSKNASFQSNKFSTECSTSKSKTSQGSSKSGAGSKAAAGGGGNSSKNQGSSKTSHKSSKKKSAESSKTSGSSSKSNSSSKSIQNSKSSTTTTTTGSANKEKSQSHTNKESSKTASKSKNKKSTSNSAPKDNADALAQTAAAEQAEMDAIFAKDPKMVALFEHKKYKAIKLLGKGSFGRVFKVLKQDTDEFFAVKVVLLALLDDNFKQNYLSSELCASMKVKHPNVVRTVDIIRAGKMVFITMEFCQNGDLAGYLIKRNGPIEEPLAKYWFTQIVNALAYMHKEHRMAHRDMKLNNVLLDQQNDTKVADFGFAKSCWDSKKHHAILSKTGCGTTLYMAPQLLQKVEYNPFMADVWAMGVLLYALLHKTFPFKKPEDSLPPTNVHPDYVKSRFTGNHSKAVIDLATRLMDPNERTRITLHETLAHEWMAKPVSRAEAFANTSQKQ